MGYARDEAGQIWETDATGNPVRRVGGTPRPPANPTFPLQAPKMQADIGNTQASTARTQVQTRGDVLENQTRQRQLQHNPISDRDQALINGMRQQQGDMAGVLRDITAAQGAVDKFQTSPGRGTLYSMGVPEDGDWPITAGLKNAFGQALPQKTKEDYQRLISLQNQSVLNSQLAQKGPQTESDAIRMKLAGVSPNKDVRPNAQLLAEQQYDATLKMGRPAFYEWWANKHGSTHALNAAGKSADEVWSEEYRKGFERMRKDPRYTGVRSAPRKPANKSRVVDFNDWKD